MEGYMQDHKEHDLGPEQKDQPAPQQNRRGRGGRGRRRGRRGRRGRRRGPNNNNWRQREEKSQVRSSEEKNEASDSEAENKVPPDIEIVRTEYLIDEDNRGYMEERLPEIDWRGGNTRHSHVALSLLRRRAEKIVLTGIQPGKTYGQEALMKREIDICLNRASNKKILALYGDPRRLSRDDRKAVVWSMIPYNQRFAGLAEELQESIASYNGRGRQMMYCFHEPSLYDNTCNLDFQGLFMHMCYPGYVDLAREFLNSGLRVFGVYIAVRDADEGTLFAGAARWDRTGSDYTFTTPGRTFTVKDYDLHWKATAGIRPTIIQMVGEWAIYQLKLSSVEATVVQLHKPGPKDKLSVPYEEATYLWKLPLPWTHTSHVDVPVELWQRVSSLYVGKPRSGEAGERYNRMNISTINGLVIKEFPDMVSKVHHVVHASRYHALESEINLRIASEMNVRAYFFDWILGKYPSIAKAIAKSVLMLLPIGTALLIIAKLLARVRRKFAPAASVMPIYLCWLIWNTPPFTTHVRYLLLREQAETSVSMCPAQSQLLAKPTSLHPYARMQLPVEMTCKETPGVYFHGPLLVDSECYLSVQKWRNCAHSQLSCLEGRVLLDNGEFAGLELVPWRRHQKLLMSRHAPWLDAIWPLVVRDSPYRTHGHLKVGSVQQYASRFPGPRRELILREENLYAEVQTIKMSVDLFVKGEKEVLLPTVADLDECLSIGLFKPPRGILQRSLPFQVGLGPTCLALNNHIKWCLDWREEEEIPPLVCWSSGWSAEKLGRWYQRGLIELQPRGPHNQFTVVNGDDSLTLFMDIHSVVYSATGDHHRMDVHQGVGAVATKLELYNGISPRMKEKTQELFKSHEITKGATTAGIKFSVPGMNKSGDGDTSSFNVCPNAGIHIVAKMDSYADADRFKSSVEVVARSFNYDVEVRLGTAEEAEFCSSLFVPVGEGFIASPKPGRQLPKMFATVLNVGKRHRAWLRGVALGWSYDAGHVPLMRGVVASVLNSTVGVSPRYDPNERKYSIRAEFRHDPTAETYEFFARRYDITVNQLISIEREMTQLGNCRYSSPLLDVVLYKDTSLKPYQYWSPSASVFGVLGAWINGYLDKMVDALYSVTPDVAVNVLTGQNFLWTFILSPILEEGIVRSAPDPVMVRLTLLILDLLQHASMGFLHWYPLTASVHIVCHCLSHRNAILLHSLYNSSMYWHINGRIAIGNAMEMLRKTGYITRILEPLKNSSRGILAAALLRVLRALKCLVRRISASRTDLVRAWEEA